MILLILFFLEFNCGFEDSVFEGMLTLMLVLIQIFPLKAQLATQSIALKISFEANVSMLFLKNIYVNHN